MGCGRGYVTLSERWDVGWVGMWSVADLYLCWSWLLTEVDVM
jgi:hypothetical protein